MKRDFFGWKRDIGGCNMGLDGCFYGKDVPPHIQEAVKAVDTACMSKIDLVVNTIEQGIKLDVMDDQW